MRILGIDPGVATVGFGVIDSEGGRQRMVRYGAITTPAGMPLAARLVQIGGDLEQLIRQFQPDEMSIEELSPSASLLIRCHRWDRWQHHSPSYALRPSCHRSASAGRGVSPR